jgi:CO/xanthine dehydrogenase Mo-binding subunit
MDSRIIGRSIPRLEDTTLQNGTGHFVDDIQLPGMLHAAFVRSPHPHARIRSIVTSTARAYGGVHVVYSDHHSRRAKSSRRDNRYRLPDFQYHRWDDRSGRHLI